MAPFSFDPRVTRLMEQCADESRPALDRLLHAAALQQYLGDALQALADVAREEEGHSWADVGTALSITRQAAHQRFAGERVLDDAGGYRSAPPTAYLAALQEARTALLAEGGRERDVRLVEAGIARMEGRPSDPAQRRRLLTDVLEALREAGGRDADVALVEQALQSDTDLAEDPVPLFVPVDRPVTGRAPAAAAEE